jgi:15-cis-phytoene synthase
MAKERGDRPGDEEACRLLIRRNSSSFYRAFRGLPKERARGVFAVYSVLRLMDDAVDSGGGEAALKPFEEGILALSRGEMPEAAAAAGTAGAAWRELSRAFRAYGLEAGPFLEMIEGQRGDIGFRQPEDLGELERYCYLVAGTVGLMILPMLAEGKNIAGLKRSAVALGEAMQLTNILRDLGEDSLRRRFYLPLGLCEKHGVSAKDFEDPLPSPALKAACSELAGLARARYGTLWSALPGYAPWARRQVALAARYYGAILEAAEASGWDVLRRRVVVSDFKKALIALGFSPGIGRGKKSKEAHSA